MPSDESLDHLPSRNPSRGFQGAMANVTAPREAWRLATAAILRRVPNSQQAVRAFLDGRYGREWAGDVVARLASGDSVTAAIEEAAADWAEQRIDGVIEDELGIPAGLPRLHGLVLVHEALMELAGDWAFPPVDPGPPSSWRVRVA